MNVEEIINKITQADSISDVYYLITTFVKLDGLNKNIISMYESFQLMEIAYRLRKPKGKSKSPETIIMNMNMALLSYLFNEYEMYIAFAEESKYTLKWYVDNSSNMSQRLKRLDHYIFCDLDGFLNVDPIHLEKLLYVRKNISRRNDPIKYHWGRFPFDFLSYEEELLKIKNGVIDHYEIDKTISPEVQDLMVAIELKAIELE